MVLLYPLDQNCWCYGKAKTDILPKIDENEILGLVGIIPLKNYTEGIFRVLIC